MKKFISVMLCAIIMLSCCSILISAAGSQDKLISRSEEILDNGDLIVTEVYENAIQPRSGKTGYSTTTYYNTNGVAIWEVVVTGTFTYNGTTSSATSATATVRLYSNSASFVSKNAYTSGNTATATGTVKYNSNQITRSASVSCDKNGNLY